MMNLTSTVQLVQRWWRKLKDKTEASRVMVQRSSRVETPPRTRDQLMAEYKEARSRDGSPARIPAFAHEIEAEDSTSAELTPRAERGGEERRLEVAHHRAMEPTSPHSGGSVDAASAAAFLRNPLPRSAAGSVPGGPGWSAGSSFSLEQWGAVSAAIHRAFDLPEERLPMATFSLRLLEASPIPRMPFPPPLVTARDAR